MSTKEEIISLLEYLDDDKVLKSILVLIKHIVK